MISGKGRSLTRPLSASSCALSRGDSTTGNDFDISVEVASESSSETSAFELDDHESESARTAPDGGYGFVIIFISFFIQFVADGITDSFGVIFVYLLSEFGRSRAETSWVSALFTAVPLLAGPLASALTESYSCRSLTVMGGILGAVGFGLSYFATTIPMLCVTLGLVGGIGFALVFVNSFIILLRWFDKRLALATGLASSGTGLGAFVFAPLTQLLLEQFGLRNALLFFAGISLLISVAGLLIQMPKYQQNQSTNSTTPISIDRTSSDIAMSASSPDIPTALHHSVDATLHHRGEMSTRYASSMMALPFLHFTDVHRRHTANSIERPAAAQRLHSQISISCPELDASALDFQPGNVLPSDDDHLPSSDSTLLLRARLLVAYMIDVRALRHNRIFLLLVMSNLLTYAPLDVPIDYLADHVRVSSLANLNSAAMLVGAIGLASTVGRVAFGLVGDRLPGANEAALLYAAAIAVAGIATAVMPLVQSYRWLMACSLVYAVFKSAFEPLFAVILVGTVEERAQANGFGVLYLVQGVASLIGPPIEGLLYDITGYYTMTFAVAGILMIIAGLLIVPVPLVHVHQSLRRRRLSERRHSNASAESLEHEREIIIT